MTSSKTIILIGAMGLAVSTATAATQKSPKLAKCDGKARRPANPYGTILPSIDPTARAKQPTGPSSQGVDVFLPAKPPSPQSDVPPSTPPDGANAMPVPPIDKIGANDVSPRFRSC